MTLVHRALDQQKDGPSPGLDGLLVKVYNTFEDFFVPLHLLSPAGAGVYCN